MRLSALVVMSCLGVLPAHAAQYVTTEVQTVAQVGYELGHRPYELRRMNPLLPVADDETIVAGTVITYIGDDDINAARMWLRERIEESDGKRREIWQNLLNALHEEGRAGIHFRYGSPTGIFFSEVLEYAQLWRAAHANAAS